MHSREQQGATYIGRVISVNFVPSSPTNLISNLPRLQSYSGLVNVLICMFLCLERAQHEVFLSLPSTHSSGILKRIAIAIKIYTIYFTCVTCDDTAFVLQPGVTSSHTVHHPHTPSAVHADRPELKGPFKVEGRLKASLRVGTLALVM